MPYSKNISLKNHTEICLREISIVDAEERHQFFVELSLAQTGMVHTVDEIDYHTHESRDKILDFTRNRRGLWLVAQMNKTIVGEVDITVRSLCRLRHNGRLTIGILPKFQSQGLGCALMERAIAWAREKPLLRIELDVLASNYKAINLYDKFGFVVEGTKKDFFRHPGGTFEDNLMMARYL